MLSRLARLAALLLLAGASAPPAQAQPDSPEKRVVVDLFLTIQVKKTADLSNLTPQDFRVTDEGQPQTLESVSRADSLPLFVAILIDSSGSRREQFFRAEREPIKEFLRQMLRPQDAAIVAAFNHRAWLDAEPTNDMPVLSAAVDRATEAPRGSSALYDAIWATCEELARSRSRRILVLASDVVDNASEQLDFRALLDAVHRTSTSVYIIRLRSANENRRVERRGTLIARELAAQTGGLVISADNPRAVANAYREIADVVSAQHVLRYAPSGLTGRSKFRKVRVDILRKGAQVITRAGYISPGAPQ